MNVDYLGFLLKPRDRIVMTSRGGESAVGLELGKIISEREARVVIDKVCASACAEFVFLPAYRPIVKPGAVIALHHTGSYVEAAAEKAGLPLSSDRVSETRDEKAFFAAHHISEVVLYEPVEMLKPVCVGVVTAADAVEREAAGAAYIKATYGAYVPDRATMERYRGAPIEGYWPKSVMEAGELVNAYTRKPISVVFGPPLTTSRHNSLPRCKAVAGPD